MARGDSFVVETNVHFPADTSQLFDAIRKAIEVCAKWSFDEGLSQWRQYDHNIRHIKRMRRIVQQLKHSTSKKPEKESSQRSTNKASTPRLPCGSRLSVTTGSAYRRRTGWLKSVAAQPA